MIRVACAIIFNNNKILVAQRGPGMKLPYKWEFPGGKIEQGETPEDCLHRELMEELNIRVEIRGLLKEHAYEYQDAKITLIPFIAVMVEGNITLSEHMNYAWVPPDELKSLDWAAADLAVMEEVINASDGLLK